MGGDLNSKKSWHPNNMKNQEHVRKAEQMAAEEKKKMKELQHQYDQERDKEELNRMVKSNSGTASDNRLHWMYDKPDKSAQQEDFLLGKALDKNSEPCKADDDVIPAVARRVVGSSMMTSSDNTQVDLARKIREDPLLLVKERERAARAALLNNPLHRKKLAEMLRKEQVQSKEGKSSKKSKKKDKDLDSMLAAKLKAISGDKGKSLKSLLDSDDSSDSSDESSKKKKKKKHKKRKQKKKKKSKSSSSDDDSEDSASKNKVKEDRNKYKSSLENRKRKSDTSSEYESKSKRSKERSAERYHSESKKRYEDDSRHRRDSKRSTYSQRERSPHRKDKLKEQEREKRLAEMAAAGAQREEERGRRVARDREREARSAPVARAAVEARTLPETLSARIHSNRQYIQRDRHHMNEHFARRSNNTIL